MAKNQENTKEILIYMILYNYILDGINSSDALIKATFIELKKISEMNIFKTIKNYDQNIFDNFDLHECTFNQDMITLVKNDFTEYVYKIIPHMLLIIKKMKNKNICKNSQAICAILLNYNYDIIPQNPFDDNWSSTYGGAYKLNKEEKIKYLFNNPENQINILYRFIIFQQSYLDKNFDDKLFHVLYSLLKNHYSILYKYSVQLKEKQYIKVKKFITDKLNFSTKIIATNANKYKILIYKKYIYNKDLAHKNLNFLTEARIISLISNLINTESIEVKKIIKSLIKTNYLLSQLSQKNLSKYVLIKLNVQITSNLSNSFDLSNNNLDLSDSNKNTISFRDYLNRKKSFYEDKLMSSKNLIKEFFGFVNKLKDKLSEFKIEIDLDLLLNIKSFKENLSEKIPKIIISKEDSQKDIKEICLNKNKDFSEDRYESLKDLLSQYIFIEPLENCFFRIIDTLDRNVFNVNKTILIEALNKIDLTSTDLSSPYKLIYYLCKEKKQLDNTILDKIISNYLGSPDEDFKYFTKDDVIKILELKLIQSSVTFNKNNSSEQNTIHNHCTLSSDDKNILYHVLKLEEDANFHLSTQTSETFELKPNNIVGVAPLQSSIEMQF